MGRVSLASRVDWVALAEQLVAGGVRAGALENDEGFARIAVIHALAGGSVRDLGPTQLRGAGLRDPERHPQAAVDAADLALALWVDDARLWRELPSGEHDRLSAWFARCARTANRTANNWRVFAIVLVGFLRAVGRADSGLLRVRASAERAVELMARPDGWFTDGGTNAFDYYTSWGFHLPLALVAMLEADAAAADRERLRVAEFLPQLDAMIGAAGAPIAFGRSLTYRFGAVSAYSAAALLGAGPPTGLRTRTAACVEWFFPDDTGTSPLRLGWPRGVQVPIQPYSGPFASYWAGRVFVNLLLPAEHAYWAPEPLAAPVRLDVVRLAVPNLLIARRDGSAVLANHGSYDPVSTDVNRLRHDPSYSPIVHSSRAGHAANVHWGGFVIRVRIGSRTRARITPLGGGADWAASTATMRTDRRSLTGRLLGLRHVRSVPRPRSPTASFASISHGAWDVHIARFARRLTRRGTVEFAGEPVTGSEVVALEGFDAPLPASAGRAVVVDLPTGSVFAAASAVEPGEAPPIARWHDGAFELTWADGTRHAIRLARRSCTVDALTNHPQPAPVSAPCVAVLTFRRPAPLARLLESLIPELRAAGATLLVIDNDPAGSARSVVEHHAPSAIYVVEPEPGIAEARNAALRAAPDTTDAIVFVDDDSTVTEGWLAALVDYANRTGADVVAGRVEFPHHGGARPLVDRGYLDPLPLRTGTRLIDASTNNVLFRRASWERLGRPWFDPAFSVTGGSDNAFFRRWHDLGAVLLHTEDAVVREILPADRLTTRWQLRRALRVGVVKGRLWRERRGALFAAGRGLVAAGAGAVELAGAVLTGRGLQAKPTRRLLSGAGQFLSVLGYRPREYRRE